MTNRNGHLALAIAATLLLATGCRQDDGSSVTTVAEPGLAVTVMTFNVENLFDNIDDPDRDDKTYLSLEAKRNEAHYEACNRIDIERWRNECLFLDWSNAVVENKLEAIAASILQINDGRGPDIIAFQEVENARILDRLSFEFLREANYGPAILIEGQDRRGIDVAFLSRLPLTGSPSLHPVEFPDHWERAGDTRGILEATFKLPDGSELTGFSVHFPAPYHPTEMRDVAYDTLNSLRAALPPERSVFAAGDFNTTRSEDGERAMFDRHARARGWTVAHDYCDGCPGTNYYSRGDSWSFLDTILFSPAEDGSKVWRLDRESVRLANGTPAQMRDNGTPRRYNAENRSGVSDHWPLLITIRPSR